MHTHHARTCGGRGHVLIGVSVVIVNVVIILLHVSCITGCQRGIHILHCVGRSDGSPAQPAQRPIPLP